jgi:hypothetical protein
MLTVFLFRFLQRSSISPKRRIKVKREEMIDLSSDPVLATARNTGKKQNVVEIN